MNASYYSLSLLIILSLQVQTLVIRADANISASVLNEINIEARPVKIHCVSDDGKDLGFHDLKYTEEFRWEFEVGSETKYTCYVLMEDDIWYFFDAFDEHRDSVRCFESCRWRILPKLVLLGLNEESSIWERFYFNATELTPNVIPTLILSDM